MTFTANIRFASKKERKQFLNNFGDYKWNDNGEYRDLNDCMTYTDDLGFYIRATGDISLAFVLGRIDAAENGEHDLEGLIHTVL